MSSSPLPPLHILVLGSGAWGTALAINMHMAGGHRVTLWSRSAEQAQAMQATHENVRYLPGIALPQGLAIDSRAVTELPGYAAGFDLVAVSYTHLTLPTILLV